MKAKKTSAVRRGAAEALQLLSTHDLVLHMDGTDEETFTAGIEGVTNASRDLRRFNEYIATHIRELAADTLDPEPQLQLDPPPVLPPLLPPPPSTSFSLPMQLDPLILPTNAPLRL